ncbi:RADIL protein, partial [Casuarius casuarius]|nr:RADIL protein [Casuarius casuarius]
MFYGSSSTMAPPSKSKLKRQSRIFSQVLYRTLSYKDRSSASSFPTAGSDDPAELSTQLSAPGVLKIFGGNICAGTNYKSVLATGSSGARELVKEALERYGLSQVNAGQYVLCDVIGRFEGSEKQWQTEGLRVLGDTEKPLLIQDLWKPREGFSRRLELRRRAEVEELASRDVDTTTAGQSRARALPVPVPRELPAAGPGRERMGSSSHRATPSGRTSPALAAWVNSKPTSFGDQGKAENCLENLGFYLFIYFSRHAAFCASRRSQDLPPSAVFLFSLGLLGLLHPIFKFALIFIATEEQGCGRAVGDAGTWEEDEEVVGRGGGRVTVRRSPSRPGLLLHYVCCRLSKQPASARLSWCFGWVNLQLRKRYQQIEKNTPVHRRPVLRPGKARSPQAPRRRLLLEFERGAEDALLGRILSLIEPAGDDHKLTPAFLLCLCVQHSATAFAPGDFGQLLLKAAKMIQRTVREKTKELAEKQSQHQDPASLSRFAVTDLLPDLQHILFWMSNAIEILYFVQQKSPTYIQSMEEELDVKGSKESLFSSTITASEEAMTVLEEVIMYTFQQCVYYISKCLYVSLPALLECNPFQNEGRETWRTAPALPDELRRVVLIYQATLDLLRQYEVHPEITSQMFAYLFFFSNTLLFNQLLDKGSSLGCFHWSKGVRLRACVRLLLEWLRGAGFEQLARQFFAKLASAADLLAMPGSQLLQMPWPCLRAEFPALSPAQLRRLLSQCQAAMDVGRVAAWQPAEEESAAALRHASLPPCLPSDEVLESFDNHPPIILPSSGFRVDLEVETLDDNIYRHLLYIRHFLWSLQSKSPHGGDGPGPAPAKVAPGGFSVLGRWEDLGVPLHPASATAVVPTGVAQPRGALAEPQLQEKLQQLQLGRSAASKAGALPADPSCLLTPPTTPLNFDSGSLESPPGTSLQDPRRNGLNGTKAGTPEGCSPTPYDYPTPASSSRSSATDDFCYVFVVELERSPLGLGMGLIDGLHTPLSSPGIYIRTLVQDSPAAADGRLSIGDRILAVNGTSLIGADYQSAVDLIRSGGKKLRFLVAKSDMEIAKKI